MIDLDDNEYGWPPGEVPGVDAAQLAGAVPAPRIVWLALRVAIAIEVIGVFSTQASAIAACSYPHDVVGPVELDARHTGHWAGAYYPLSDRPAWLEAPTRATG